MATPFSSLIGSALSGGRYTVTAKLGEGGMGTVYRAVDNHLRSDVVIKLLHQSMAMDAEFSRRLYDEVRLLVRLSHPHIVKVTDVGAWNDVPFAVLQYLSGGSLDDRLAAWRGQAALGALTGWLGPIGGALDYVHAQGMVHRDVKPGNILFDAQGHAYLGDFGIAKALVTTGGRTVQAALTGTGIVLGTPHYMAPELIMGDPYDGRVDQYALAVTVFELLCGRRPFEHEVATRILLMQAQESPPRLTSLCPWAPAPLEDALFKGLAKNPSDRHPTCAAFAAAVIQAARAGATGRVRLRCGSCTQALSLTAEMLAKLTREQRPAPCPKCGSPVDLESGEAILAGSNPAGASTRLGAATPNAPNGTVEFETIRPGGASPPPVQGTVRFHAPRTATVQEPRPLDDVQAEPDDKATARSWVPFGVAAAAAGLVGILALLWTLSPGRSNQSAAPTERNLAAASGTPAAQPGALPPPASATPDPTANAVTTPTAPPASRPPFVAPRLAAPAVPTIMPGQATPRTLPPNPNVGAGAPTPPTLALANRSPNEPGEDAGRDATMENQAGDAASEQGGDADTPDPKPEPTPKPEPRPELVADDEEPSQRNVPLQRVLANPHAFAGQLITLEQVYCIGNFAIRLPDGSLGVDIIESDLELTDSSALVRFGEAFRLGLDPTLADRLVELYRMDLNGDSKLKTGSYEWIMQPANLTVKVAAKPTQLPGAVRIVRLELFEQFRNEVRGSAKKKLVVLFETRTITPNGDSRGLGNNDEWQKVRKLGHAYNQFQRFFNGIQRQYNQQRWAAFDRQLNQLIAVGTSQSAAAQAALQNQLRQFNTPRLTTPR